MDERKELTEITKALESWESKHAAEFASERKKETEFLSESGIPIKRLYTPLDLKENNFDYLKDAGLPGEYPYTRGITPTMYRGAIWGISQYSGYPTPEATNKLWKEQISRGLNSVLLAFDLASQRGLDPDNPRAEGEVARIGVSLYSLRDYEIAFDGIDVEKIYVGMVFNALSIVGLASHLAIAEQQKADLKKLTGCQQNDILKEFVARGNYVYPPEPSMRLAVDVISYVCANAPKMSGIHVCTYHLCERGANPVHEGAFALANLIGYLDAAVQRGIDIDKFAPAIAFLGIFDHTNFFEHVAKNRAMRRLYARILKERYKAKDPRSLQFRAYLGNKGTSLHREQYMNNIARDAIASICAVLSGAQSQDMRAYDEQFGIPTSEAITTNVRIQQIAAYETGITDTIDPLAGSYFVESLTSEMEERMWKEIEIIDKMGGAVKAIEQGYEQRKIAEDAYQWQRDFESGKIWRVGVNVFRSEEQEKPARVYRAKPDVEKERVEAVRAMKAQRDNRKVKKALDELKAAAKSPATATNNLVPPVLDAVKSYATIGEIADVFREVWGEFREPTVL